MLSAPTRKTERSPNTMIAYLVLMLVAFILMLLFTFPCKFLSFQLRWKRSNLLSNWLEFCIVDVSFTACVMNLSFFGLTLLFFSMAACKEPGYLRNDSVNFMDMLNVVDSTQLCPDCVTIRTSRSRHCSVCGHCIERFDHHCPWINNCVGLKNHNAFFMYLTF